MNLKLLIYEKMILVIYFLSNLYIVNKKLKSKLIYLYLFFKHVKFANKYVIDRGYLNVKNNKKNSLYNLIFRCQNNFR